MKTAGSIFLKIIFIIALLGGSIIVAMAQDEPQAVPQPAKKAIPRITFQNLSPPFKDYDYFQGHQEYPFQVQATSFNLVNAWWLAEASTLVYADEDFAYTIANFCGCRLVICYKLPIQKVWVLA